jgi:hypothetical protein
MMTNTGRQIELEALPPMLVVQVEHEEAAEAVAAFLAEDNPGARVFVIREYPQGETEQWGVLMTHDPQAFATAPDG